MYLNFPPPDNWQDFQHLTVRLVEQICEVGTVHEYGRQGQRQHGVDVYGEMPGNLQLGVQCKEMKAGKTLSKADIKKEADDALSFTPKLRTYVIATTLSEDTVIHDIVAELNSTGAYPFTLAYWSWSHYNLKLNSSNQLVADCYEKYAKAFGVNQEEADLLALRDGFDRNAFIDDFKHERQSDFIAALADTALFLQTGMSRDRISQSLIAANYPLNLLPKGRVKTLRARLLKSVRDLRKQALEDANNGVLNASRANEYNSSRGVIITMLNKELIARRLPPIKPSYWD